MPETMTPRERVVAALNHKEPDRVPITLGGSANHLTEQRYVLLCDHFGVQDVPRRTLVGFYTTLDYNLILDKLGTDFRFIHIRPPQDYVSNLMIGALYIRLGIDLSPMILGGPQEHSLRAGTENVPGIVGLGAAMNLVRQHRADERDRLMGLRKYLVNGLQAIGPVVIVNGLEEKTAAHILSVSFVGADAEMMLIRLRMLKDSPFHWVLLVIQKPLSHRMC